MLSIKVVLQAVCQCECQLACCTYLLDHTVTDKNNNSIIPATIVFRTLQHINRNHLGDSVTHTSKKNIFEINSWVMYVWPKTIRAKLLLFQTLSKLETLKNSAITVYFNHCKMSPTYSSTDYRWQFIKLSIHHRVQHHGPAWRSASSGSVCGRWDSLGCTAWIQAYSAQMWLLRYTRLTNCPIWPSKDYGEALLCQVWSLYSTSLFTGIYKTVARRSDMAPAHMILILNVGIARTDAICTLYWMRLKRRRAHAAL